MAFPIGTKLGSYVIVAPLGAGGMGEVYRARDTKLGREVAIKVLLQAFAAEPERMTRFEREAMLLASLNHPNIASIYGFEDTNGIGSLIMELVGGPTLGERLQRGPLPLDEALPVARQIAEGLEYAHEHGVVHRDLKPGNIKLTTDGVVKILDFGLAKVIEADLASTDIFTSPTITRMATQAGIILGTAAYMSPEQAKGKPVDRRTDIWAFGCVLFEMLSGKLAFRGESVADVLAAVVMKDPEWSSLPANIPSRVRELMQRCTKKEQKQRLQSIGDARITIEEVLSGSPDSSTSPQPQSRGLWQFVLLWALIGLLALTAGLLLFHSWSGREQPQQSVRSSILPPLNYEFADGGTAAISPNGRFLTFVAGPADGTGQLWVRPADSLVAKALPGTEGAYNPFWSPDNQWIAFYSKGKLKKISIGGGAPLDICDARTGRGGSWGPDGTILLVPDLGTSVHSVSAAGGSPVPVIQLDTSLAETLHRWPVLLPDGKHFLFLSQAPQNAIYAGSLGSTERKLILKNDTNALFVPPGYLLYVRSRSHSLMAQPFDAKRLELSGNPVQIAEGVPVNGEMLLGLFAASQNGLLSLQTRAGRLIQPVWVDHSGKVLDVIGEPAAFETIRVSPNGEKVAFVARDAPDMISSIWIYDSTGQRKARLTFPPYAAQFPTWSPDGNRLVFSSDRKGPLQLFSISATGVGQPEPLLPPGLWDRPTSWSADGRFLTFMRKTLNGENNWNIWILPMSGDKKPYPLLESDYHQGKGTFSPNGKWLAYESNENGHSEIYVVPFPSADSKLMVSTESGKDPQWSADGEGLYYITDDGTLMASSLQDEGKRLRVTAIEKLFKTNSPSFGVSRDGKRFLIFRDAENQPPGSITLITNWTAELKQ